MDPIFPKSNSGGYSNNCSSNFNLGIFRNQSFRNEWRFQSYKTAITKCLHHRTARFWIYPKLTLIWVLLLNIFIRNTMEIFKNIYLLVHLNIAFLSLMWWYMYLITAFKWQRQGDFCKSEASLIIYRASSRKATIMTKSYSKKDKVPV